MEAAELARRIRLSAISPVALVRVLLGRIERLDPRIGSYVTVTADRALAEARSAERALRTGDTEQLGPLHGIPISVKDLIPTSGVRTTFGSPAFEQYVPEMDSPDVGRVFRAGAILLGKTNTSELGLSMTTEDGVFPPTRNPWDVSRSAGGSSGGSSAALAARLCPLSLGSDAGGSVRVPTAACGVVGLKPSRGRVILSPYSCAAIAGFASSGLMARSVDDVALLLDALSAPSAASIKTDAHTLRPWRVGWTTRSEVVEVDYEVAGVVERAALLLAQLGHDVHEGAPDVSGVFDSFMTVVAAHTALTPVADPAQLGAHARAIYEEGRTLSASDYLRAEFAALDLHRRVMEWYRRFDVLLCPTLPVTAPPLGALTGTEQEQWDRGKEFGAFAYWVNMTGQPAISLPLAASADGLPIGVQLIGRPSADETILMLARQLEEAIPWAGRVPGIARD